LITQLAGLVPSFDGLEVLDLGCGEGKNALFLASVGAKVVALDVSERAISNALRLPQSDRVVFDVDDMRTTRWIEKTYDVVVAYGSLHCLQSEADSRMVLGRMHAATKTGGYNVICAFNRRFQDLSAHPGFAPLLLDHEFYVSQYSAWKIPHCSDSDLLETHPHNMMEHRHSLTRILARKAQDV
jgi:cyclopropane fatty-acyl-phospholipid synthase-like methyltransferase